MVMPRQHTHIPAAEWTQRKERSQRPVVRFMVWLSLLCGRRASRVLLRAIALYFLLFAPKARGALQVYYQRLWRRRAGWGELYRHFFAFASVIHDRVFCWAGSMNSLISGWKAKTAPPLSKPCSTGRAW